MYRLVPNATHLIQPLEKSVFGPLKKEWYKTAKNTSENPRKPSDKKNFALNLHETYIAFHKPSIIIWAFTGSSICPVRSSAISNDKLKPPNTFIDTKIHGIRVPTVTKVEEKESSTAASKAFQLWSGTVGIEGTWYQTKVWAVIGGRFGYLKGYRLPLQGTQTERKKDHPYALDDVN